MRAHLLRDLDELVADHAHGDGIDLAPRRCFLRSREPQDPVGEHAQLLVGHHERRRVELLDHGRALEHRGRRQVLAPVDRRGKSATGEVDVADRARRRKLALPQGDGRRAGSRAERGHVCVDQLDRPFREAVTEDVVVQRVERSERVGEPELVECAGPERHLELMVLAGVAHAE